MGPSRRHEDSFLSELGYAGTSAGEDQRVEKGDRMSIINLKLEPGDKLKPCPFCGEHDDCLELGNTHTPCYVVACLNCGAEITGDYFGEAYDFDRTSGGHLPSHEKAKASAIAKWNRRDAGVDRAFRAAKLFIEATPCDPDINNYQAAKWVDYLNALKEIGEEHGTAKLPVQNLG
jgi:Lar family restriction alleviation protein